MSTLEERVAFLEGKVEEHSRGLDGVRDAINQLEVRIDARFEGLDRRFTSLEERMDRRFEAIDRRFETIDRRFEAMDCRFDALDQKISRQFVWLVSAHVTTLVTVVAALAAALFSG